MDKGTTKPPTLTSRCLDEVRRLGRANSSQVLAAVGPHISSAQAVNRARTRLKHLSIVGGKRTKRQRDPDSALYTEQFLAEWGRKELVNNLLIDSYRKGYLRRVARATYAIA